MHARSEAIRESAAQYEGSDELRAARIAAEQTMNDDLAQGKDLLGNTTEAALPINLKDQLDPLDPGQTQFIRDIASTRNPTSSGGIKGADLGIPAKLADGTPVLLFGDCNKPGEKGGHNGGIVAATVENTPGSWSSFELSRRPPGRRSEDLESVKAIARDLKLALAEACDAAVTEAEDYLQTARKSRSVIASLENAVTLPLAPNTLNE